MISQCIFHISWPFSNLLESKKQHTVSWSFAEVEYHSMALNACELIWLQQFLSNLNVSSSSSTHLYYDNQAAMHIVNSPVYHERTKHIEIECHFIRDCIQQGSLLTRFVHSQHQVANLFTKALRKQQFQFLVGKLDIQNLHAPT